MTARRFSFVLVAVAFSVTALTAAGMGVRATYGAQTTADEPQYLLSALSLWEDGDLDISDELAVERYRQFHEVALPAQTEPLPDGSHVSPHSPLLPVLLAAPMGLWGWMGGKAFLALLTGLVAAVLVWIAHRRLDVSGGVAVVVVGLFVLAPPLAVYATQVYPEIVAALAVTVGIAALTGPPRPPALVVAAAAVMALPWLAIKFVPVAAVLAMAALLRAGGRSRLWLGAGFVVAAATLVVAHWSLYGGLTPYATGDHFVGGEFTAVGSAPNLWGRTSRLVGLLVDRGFGLGEWQPAYLLMPLLLGYWWRQRTSTTVLLISLLAVGWVVAALVALTMHGWWFPGRQVVVVLPAVVLLAAQWADTARTRLAGVAALGAVGVVSFGFLLGEGLAGRLTWVVDFGSTSNPLYRALSPLLPNYMDPSAGTWLRHFAWLMALLTLVGIGWRTGIAPSRLRRGSTIERERHAI